MSATTAISVGPIIKTLGGLASGPAGAGAGVAKTLVGGALGAVANGVMDQVTGWMVDAAKAIDGFVAHVALATTTPQLGAGWFTGLFGYLSTFALPVAALFAVAGIGAAALMRNGQLLGQTVFGIVRAGWGTAVAVALVVIVAAAASGVTSDIAARIPQSFFDGLSSGWGGSGFGGLVASALAFVVALITVIAGVVLWLELLFRMAGLYVAVALLPLVLAAAVYPPLNSMLARMLRLLVVLLVFPIVAEVILLVGAAVTAGGASLSGSVASAPATLIAGALIFILAALAPWATLKLIGLEGGLAGGGAAAAGAVGVVAATGGGPAAAAAMGAVAGTGGAGAAGVVFGAQAVARHTGSRMNAAAAASPDGNQQGASEAPDTAAAAAGG